MRGSHHHHHHTDLRADKASSIELKFDRNKGEVGDILIGTVRINNIKNFAGFQVNIVYDPKVLMAVDPETGKEFTSSTFPPGRTVLKNNAYGPIQIADNDPEKGILNFALAYSYIAGYKETGVAEESGIIAKIGFKILQKKSTAVKFQDTLSMPGAISGTQLFDWDGEVITGYEVIQPDVLSLGDEPF
uniref:COG1196: Chromosome segregation ATPases n=1 Tax=Acetivibrio thermocellus (strain ATCC 27405 / DSM 1237 / JCM 9322 / NBRC 103400 / NCIMB 10682 / NRRL B-4536 / VPI 7372) TaxID=203119 RepID=UPI00005C93C4|nr:Chain A, COG1196: Chromosome segregation ATPases [Acetivibrio thermocellus ATCC 27405]4FL4_B Chain B, Scaffolding dockerin binding protein A [Acetivibrio thermocellus]4FL4_E Chain E, Scaffolding dockerin binding protein A [Acetivibrio thermocellus]4FL4_H Chain H, Scaffolding dockerin binding protein A [Acetivibrio thermocellus]4FL4_K Chain K, Scaffolding dockerin binding protein A [Acetivibrio thermocellus]